MKISVLGTEYELVKRKWGEDKTFEKNSWVGYCDEVLKKIVICDMKTYPDWEEKSDETILTEERNCLRHEITHAFLNESGLSYSSLNYSGGWAKNEEMVDWFAIQGEKIYKCWQNAEKLFFEKPVVIELDGKEIARSVINEAEMLKNLKDKGMVEIG